MLRFGDHASQFREVIAKRLISSAESKLRDKQLTSTETILRTGDPAKTILDLAETRGVDRIVIGSRGLGGASEDAEERGEWIEAELTGRSFPDARLDHRLRKQLEGMAGAVGESLPTACQDWANSKAAYRFFVNERVSEGAILDGHFRAAAERVAARSGPILVLH